MNELLQDYDRITGFGHRVDISELRETTREWPSDVLVDREEIVQKIGRVNALLDEVEEAERSSSLPFPSYDNIVTKQKTTVKIRENDGRPGMVSVFLNGQPIATNADVKDGSFDLTLRPGPNTVTVAALNPSCDPNPETYRIEFENNLYGDEYYLMTVPPGNSRAWTIGLPLITIDGRDFPEAARHVHDYLNKSNSDSIWTLDRANRVTRGRQAKAAYRSVEGDDPVNKISRFDLDEVPFASVKEGGSGADVRPIPNRDNQDAGNRWRIQINGYRPDEEKDTR